MELVRYSSCHRIGGRALLRLVVRSGEKGEAVNTIKGWLERVYEDHGIGATLATVIVLVAIIVLFMYLDVNALEWLQ